MYVNKLHFFTFSSEVFEHLIDLGQVEVSEYLTGTCPLDQLTTLRAHIAALAFLLDHGSLNAFSSCHA